MCHQRGESCEIGKTSTLQDGKTFWENGLAENMLYTFYSISLSLDIFTNEA